MGGLLVVMSVLDLVEEHRETQQILGSKARPPRCDDLEGVRRCQARRRSRHRVNGAVGRLVPNAIAMTIAALIDERELASVQRVERMGDANPLSRFLSVGCNW
jgi:hypothetical protein